MSGGLLFWRTWVALAAAFAGLTAGMAHAADTENLSGPASYYSENYKGVTASGEPYDPVKFTCAHPTLPFGTRLRVTDGKTQRSVIVVVNDRGPFNKGRMIDLSLAAAKMLNMVERGIIAVTMTIETGAEKAADAAAR